ncbi:hypothetical protein MRQ36_23510 [Micromonospora sp. R77]|uniref:hypothetical protein n=1 Tax=Micromonospora sp. R77 TaxID=2925836 RepID=UPI001F623DD0|nr:hypothetical protein [Micromonospora sp. R77]MCI4065371.1 hypothetical protein [Micromonospora sp. R77]
MCALLALAFLVPLGLSLRAQAREEKLADAARRAALVTGALAVSTDPAAVQRAVAAAGDDPATRPVVHGLGGDESAGRADAAALAWPPPSVARWSPTSTAACSGWTRWCSATGSPWSRSSCPTRCWTPAGADAGCCCSPWRSPWSARR